jgi:hypothetical protein
MVRAVSKTDDERTEVFEHATEGNGINDTTKTRTANDDANCGGTALHEPMAGDGGGRRVKDGARDTEQQVGEKKLIEFLADYTLSVTDWNSRKQTHRQGKSETRWTVTCQRS